jgi:hypothetical protein
MRPSWSVGVSQTAVSSHLRHPPKVTNPPAMMEATQGKTTSRPNRPPIQSSRVRFMAPLQKSALLCPRVRRRRIPGPPAKLVPGRARALDLRRSGKLVFSRPRGGYPIPLHKYWWLLLSILRLRASRYSQMQAKCRSQVILCASELGAVMNEDIDEVSRLIQVRSLFPPIVEAHGIGPCPKAPPQAEHFGRPRG